MLTYYSTVNISSYLQINRFLNVVVGQVKFFFFIRNSKENWNPAYDMLMQVFVTVSQENCLFDTVTVIVWRMTLCVFLSRRDPGRSCQSDGPEVSDKYGKRCWWVGGGGGWGQPRWHTPVGRWQWQWQLAASSTVWTSVAKQALCYQLPQTRAKTSRTFCLQLILE